MLGNLALAFFYLDLFSKENRIGCPFCGGMLSQAIQKYVDRNTMRITEEPFILLTVG